MQWVEIIHQIRLLELLNYLKKKILWAKRNSVPFRSNLKIFNNYLISADQNNNLIFFDKKNGEQIKKIPTEKRGVVMVFQNYLLD